MLLIQQLALAQRIFAKVIAINDGVRLVSEVDLRIGSADWFHASSSYIVDGLSLVPCTNWRMYMATS